MNLILDFGNSYQKAAVVADGEIVHLLSESRIDVQMIQIIEKQYKIENAILSSVVHHDKNIDIYLANNYNFICFSSDTPVPIENHYKTVSSLGSDRLACAVAAHHFFKENDVLILQLGTCITSDFVTKDGVYKGGSISPGLDMRFASLHHFSAKLPLVEYREINYITGSSTEESILSGVINGVTAECNYLIEQYKEKYPLLKIILTGGSLKKIENTIKSEIIAFPNLVISGLDLILNHNVKK
jgi:type III pantothenate kinase